MCVEDAQNRTVVSIYCLQEQNSKISQHKQTALCSVIKNNE